MKYYFYDFQPRLKAAMLKCHRRVLARFPEQSWQPSRLGNLDMNLNTSLNVFHLNKGKLEFYTSTTVINKSRASNSVTYFNGTKTMSQLQQE